MDDATKDVQPKYWGNVLNAFEAGLQLDLRVRLAVDFLKSPYFSASTGTPREIAEHALNLATELLEVSADRGLVKDLPDNGEINAPLRHHIERGVRAGAHQQAIGQRVMRDEAGGLMPAGASVIQGMHG